MAKLWTLKAKYDAWLEVELAAVKAWQKLGLIPEADAKKILKNATFDVKAIDKIEQKTKHDMIAFLTSVGESLGEERRFLHYGLTSSDCIDTANALLMKRSLKVILKDVKLLLKVLKKRALEHQNTVMVGRSHGIHGEPTTFGLVLGLWYAEIKRHYKHLKQCLGVVGVGQMSGAMGNFAHAPLELEELVCKYLDLEPDLISNQIIQRDRYAHMINALALLASSCEKMAVAVRHYQRTEVYEAEEYFAVGQKGSSAMPHKRNPILTENITGLCRMIRSYAQPTMENVALWHERDISHSSVERFVLPDAFVTTDFMLTRLKGVIENLTVYPKNMQKNLYMTGGLVFSQRVLLELPLRGVSREEAYAIVQRHAMRVWEDLQSGKSNPMKGDKPLFLHHLLKDDELKKKLKPSEIEACFEVGYYLKNVAKVFKRLFR